MRPRERNELYLACLPAGELLQLHDAQATLELYYRQNHIETTPGLRARDGERYAQTRNELQARGLLGWLEVIA